MNQPGAAMLELVTRLIDAKALLVSTGTLTSEQITVTKDMVSASSIQWGATGTTTQDNAWLAFDRDISTATDCLNNPSWILVDLGTIAAIGSVKYYPRSINATLINRINGSILQGSVDGTNFVNLYTINGITSAQWFTATITDSTKYRYFRFYSPYGLANVAELQLYKPVIDKALLAMMLDNSANIDTSKYTYAKAAALEAAISKAQSIHVSSNATQAEVDEATAALITAIDQLLPSVTATIDPAVPNGLEGWYTTPVTVTLSPSEYAQYSVDDGASWISYTQPLILGQDGQYTVIYRSSDDADNAEAEKKLNVKLDQTPPTAVVAYSITSETNNTVDATITVDEPITITNNNGSASYTFLLNGSFTFEFIDEAGNPGTATATVNNIIEKCNDAPGTAVLSDDNGYDGIQNGNYNITMNLWYGNNGRIYKLYENGILIDTQILSDDTPNAHTVVTSITNRKNGTYLYNAELTNAYGTTTAATHTVSVTEAAPNKPVLSNDNWDSDGNFTINMNMWWGINGTTYHLYENGALIDTQVLTDNSPSQQLALTVITNRAAGTYEYLAELVNYAGVTSSDTITVTVTH
jgi:hypothetical protein